MPTSAFRPLLESDDTPGTHLPSRTPAVFRGLAADWPAVRTWTFPRLAALGRDLAVQLVQGDRESGPTRFSSSTLGAYAELLAHDAPPGDEPVYLKEFDLLKHFPDLRSEVDSDRLFPSGAMKSCTTWIGPAHARTGLHCDLLDNLAVLITGRKRFYLAHPDAVEQAGQASPKYDAWARLSQVDARELVEAAQGDDTGFFVVDLEPGDVLYVPAYWWHEVVNTTSSILLSGFFGTKAQVLSRWANVQARQGLHRLGFLGRDACTCHEERSIPR